MAEPADLDAVVRAVTDVVAAVSASDVKRLKVRFGEFSVDVARADAEPGAGPPLTTTTTAPAAPAVTAPMMGVFYRRPAPADPPFVAVGQRVEAGQQVAIVEAMKTMNAVVAQHTGTVREFLVEDGEIVEYGERLIGIDAD